MMYWIHFKFDSSRVFVPMQRILDRHTHNTQTYTPSLPFSRLPTRQLFLSHAQSPFVMQGAGQIRDYTLVGITFDGKYVILIKTSLRAD